MKNSNNKTIINVEDIKSVKAIYRKKIVYLCFNNNLCASVSKLIDILIDHYKHYETYMIKTIECEKLSKRQQKKTYPADTVSARIAEINISLSVSLHKRLIEEEAQAREAQCVPQ